MAPLRKIWAVMDAPTGKRLAPFLVEMVAVLERAGELDLEPEVRAKIRVPVEWGIAHTKNWRILATRYRSDLARIDIDVQAVIGLEKLNEQHSGRPLTFQRIKNAVSE